MYYCTINIFKYSTKNITSKPHHNLEYSFFLHIIQLLLFLSNFFLAISWLSLVTSFYLLTDINNAIDQSEKKIVHNGTYNQCYVYIFSHNNKREYLIIRSTLGTAEYNFAFGNITQVLATTKMKFYSVTPRILCST